MSSTSQYNAYIIYIYIKNFLYTFSFMCIYIYKTDFFFNDVKKCTELPKHRSGWSHTNKHICDNTKYFIMQNRLNVRTAPFFCNCFCLPGQLKHIWVDSCIQMWHCINLTFYSLAAADCCTTHKEEAFVFLCPGSSWICLKNCDSVNEGKDWLQ